MQTETHICIIIIGAMEGACLYIANQPANAGFVVQLPLLFMRFAFFVEQQQGSSTPYDQTTRQLCFM